VLPGQRESVSPEHVARVRAAYDAEVAFVDAQIGRLVAELERRGARARTTILVSADHGEEFWEHGAFEHGHSLYDELVRVPLLIASGDEQGASVVDTPVRTLDVMPTIFELLGLPPAPTFEGQSLLPVWRGADRNARSAVLDSTLYGHDKVALRTERLKLILDREPRAEHPLELYDWSADPLEQHDLAGAQPELAAHLRSELEARLAAYAIQAKDLRPGELQDLSPANQAEIQRQLDALGYGGD
jgi:arylsulfatase A-like enzyme